MSDDDDDLRTRIAGWFKARRAWRHCPHHNVRGIYGDEANHTPGYRRAQCMDCGNYLDGQVFHRMSNNTRCEHEDEDVVEHDYRLTAVCKQCGAVTTLLADD
jgi:hypothetical protein